MATGFIIMLFTASVGVTFGGVFGSNLISFAGILAGANLITTGVLMADDPCARVGAAAFLRCHFTVVGLGMASCAVAAVAGEVGPVICFVMFAVLLLGLALINIGVLGK